MNKLILFFFIPFCLHAIEPESDWKQRIESLLIVEDLETAYHDVQSALQEHPYSRDLQKLAILVAARRGNETRMMQLWNQYFDLSDRTLLEEMAWGVLHKGFKSTNIVTRLYTLIAAFETQSPKGVLLVREYLNDSHRILRTVALELATKLPDKMIKDTVVERFKKEKVLKVRCQAIRAMGPLKIKEAQELLYPLLLDSKISTEERKTAVTALVESYDQVDLATIQQLISSERAVLRLLACELVVHFDFVEGKDLISTLLQDPSPEVRKAALITLGVVQSVSYTRQEMTLLAKNMLTDRHPEVAITAAWLLTLYNPTLGNQALNKWLSHPARNIRLLASGAISATGENGVPLAKYHLDKHPDPLVRVGLAMGLIGQRENIESAGEEIHTALQRERGRLMWEEKDIFRYVSPSHVKYRPEIPQYPEVMNQLVRMELLQMLSIIEHPQSQNAWRQFLKNHVFGVTGIATILLLQEGEEDAFPFLRPLLNDPDPRVQLQAALVLTLWGNDHEMETRLHTIYPTADRKSKEKIIEGIGKVGSSASIEFLIERFNEPFQHLRVIAASALLQTLSK